MNHYQYIAGLEVLSQHDNGTVNVPDVCGSS